MDMKAFAAAVMPELHRRLAPMNIQVTSKSGPWHEDLLFRFECEVRISGHFFNGQKITIDRIVSERELYQELGRDKKRNAEFAAVTAERMSYAVLGDFYEYFSRPIPEAPGVDYRNSETIPEDFYSA